MHNLSSAITIISAFQYNLSNVINQEKIKCTSQSIPICHVNPIVIHFQDYVDTAKEVLVGHLIPFRPEEETPKFINYFERARERERERERERGQCIVPFGL